MIAFDYTERILARVKTLGRVTSQNRLMAASDRDIAMAMMYMSDGQRGELFSLLSRSKSRRVSEELLLHERLCITHKQYELAARNILGSLEGPKATPPIKSYIRPRRARSERRRGLPR
jgi:hypothetical protein